jgi:hypothetical protein
MKSAVKVPAIQKLLYRRQEAAYALGMSVRAIDYMIADRKLTTRRVGRCVVIPAADVSRVAEEILQGKLLHGVAAARV